MRASIDADVDNVATLLRVSGLLPRELDVDPLLAEAKRQLAEEADYDREGAQMALFGRLLADDPALVVPQLDEEFTTASVLAMSFVEGQPIESLVTAPQALSVLTVPHMMMPKISRALPIFRRVQGNSGHSAE